ncbi:hypothetical protein H4P12_17115 [Paracoccus sp. 11-3]|uniref:Uncharacterized protein n=1 Tax=Paracoccus amoyensis TaxID=2760093 RepID=A0A926GJE2_9RHOB|nr:MULTISPECIES: hypothetical protein [Paracoccus]MBC9248389.1 hypothetical protein [Paracoccus amoyensis]NHF74844.1 hypothetical protein [Paracoccus xiamenensis]
MDVSVVIVEQLDLGGELRSFQMKAGSGDHVTVAFADEYDEPRSGPFHFLDRKQERAFSEGFAECSARKLTASRYRVTERGYEFNTSWRGVLTERGRLSYYAVSLPEHAIPVSVRFFDLRSGREYQKSVNRDDQRKRFVLYLECRSSHGSFDFGLEVRFVVSAEDFYAAQYVDESTTGYGAHPDAYEYLLRDGQQHVVQQFFMESMNMGDHYQTGQAGAVGPNSRAENNTFQQIWNQRSSDVDLPQLAEELRQLRMALKAEGTTIEHDKAIASVAAAEEAAQKNDGAGALRHLQAAGKWTLDVATKIGTSVAAKAITSAMGI